MGWLEHCAPLSHPAALGEACAAPPAHPRSHPVHTLPTLCSHPARTLLTPCSHTAHTLLTPAETLLAPCSHTPCSQAAARLGVSEARMYELAARSGKLPPAQRPIVAGRPVCTKLPLPARTARPLRSGGRAVAMSGRVAVAPGLSRRN